MKVKLQAVVLMPLIWGLSVAGVAFAHGGSHREVSLRSAVAVMCDPCLGDRGKCSQPPHCRHSQHARLLRPADCNCAHEYSDGHGTRVRRPILFRHRTVADVFLRRWKGRPQFEILGQTGDGPNYHGNHRQRVDFLQYARKNMRLVEPRAGIDPAVPASLANEPHYLKYWLWVFLTDSDAKVRFNRLAPAGTDPESWEEWERKHKVEDDYTEAQYVDDAVAYWDGFEDENDGPPPGSRKKKLNTKNARHVDRTGPHKGHRLIIGAAREAMSRPDFLYPDHDDMDHDYGIKDATNDDDGHVSQRAAHCCGPCAGSIRVKTTGDACHVCRQHWLWTYDACVDAGYCT